MKIMEKKRNKKIDTFSKLIPLTKEKIEYFK